MYDNKIWKWKPVILAFRRTGDSSKAPQVPGSNLHWWGFFFFLSPGWGFGSAVVSERRGQLHPPTTQDHGCTQSVSSRQWYIIILHVFFLDVLFNFMWYSMCIAAVVDVNVSGKECVWERGVCVCLLVWVNYLCFIPKSGIHFKSPLLIRMVKQHFLSKKQNVFGSGNIVEILWSSDWLFSSNKMCLKNTIKGSLRTSVCESSQIQINALLSSLFDISVIVHEQHVHTKDFDLRSRVFDQHLTLDLYYMSYQLAC